MSGAVGGHLGFDAAFFDKAANVAGGQENKSTRDDNCGYQSQQRFHDVLVNEAVSGLQQM
jgi:hypothetical protein